MLITNAAQGASSTFTYYLVPSSGAKQELGTGTLTVPQAGNPALDMHSPVSKSGTYELDVTTNSDGKSVSISGQFTVQ